MPPTQVDQNAGTALRKRIRDKNVPVRGYDKKVCLPFDNISGDDPVAWDGDKEKRDKDGRPVPATPVEFPPEPEWRRMAQPVPSK